MKNRFNRILLLSGSAILCCTLLGLDCGPAYCQSATPAFEWIDAHAHAYSPSPVLFSMLRRLNMRIVDIAVVDKHEGVDPREAAVLKDETVQNRLALLVFQKSKGRVPWVSTFDPETWESPQFSDKVIALLDKTFSEGAVGV